MRRPTCLALPALALLAACGGGADPDAVLETVRATEQAQIEAIANDDLRGVVRNYHADAVLVTPGRGAVQGIDAIGGAYEALLGDPGLTLEITPGPAWAAASGDMAVTTYTGRLTTTDAASGEPVTTEVGNQTVWRKADGAPWMIVSDQTVALPVAAGGATLAAQ